MWPVSVAGFHDCLNVFIAWYIRDTDLEDMRLFLDCSKKPYTTTCMELSSHLCFMNQLMRFFPGANNTAPFSEACLKLIFLNMMSVKFQTQFAISGRRIMDNAFSLDQLVDYMTVLEEASQALRKLECQNQMSREWSCGRGQLQRSQYYGQGRRGFLRFVTHTLIPQVTVLVILNKLDNILMVDGAEAMANKELIMELSVVKEIEMEARIAIMDKDARCCILMET